MHKKAEKNDYVTVRHAHPLYAYQSGFILAIKSYMTPNGAIQTFFDIGVTDNGHRIHSVITVNEHYINPVLK